MVQLAAGRLLLVLITDTGRVEQRVVEFPVDVDDETVAELRSLLNTAFAGAKLADARAAVADLLDTAPPHCARSSAGSARRCWRPWSSPARTGW